MRAVLGVLGVLSIVAFSAACSRRGGGPHLQLVTPAAATPDFGDAPSRSSESLRQGPGGGGGGVASSSEPARGGSAGNGVPIGPIVGGAVGIGATAAAVGAGAIECKPGTDMPSGATKVNLCSGERAPGPPAP
jgi:hypothetical protein